MAEKISIHIPRVGDDAAGDAAQAGELPFQSTSPVWGMTTHEESENQLGAISIHIPRVGDDVWIKSVNRLLAFISIHIPRVGDDELWALRALLHGRFQSTSPVWGMTCWAHTPDDRADDFNPHPPCGG